MPVERNEDHSFHQIPKKMRKRITIPRIPACPSIVILMMLSLHNFLDCRLHPSNEKNKRIIYYYDLLSQ